jgi:hypothetical protein
VGVGVRVGVGVSICVGVDVGFWGVGVMLAAGRLPAVIAKSSVYDPDDGINCAVICIGLSEIA